MRVNIGSADRAVRLVLGVVLILAAQFSGLVWFAQPWAYWASLLVGAVLVLTAIVRFCPLYTLFGLSTRKVLD